MIFFGDSARAREVLIWKWGDAWHVMRVMSESNLKLLGSFFCGHVTLSDHQTWTRHVLRSASSSNCVLAM